ncbi:hypothetical protein BDF20DRAFT_853353, partial [Mycotypha africana]|uniref:uncharacterized protein n=1 Tax=Mycotypha africana TaxID=64632 RepID=UPI0023003F35
MAITREQAIYLLFCEEINKENISRLTERINSLKDIEICYEKDPHQPILLPIVRINANQFTYHRYLSNALKLEKKSINENIKLTKYNEIIVLRKRIREKSNLNFTLKIIASDTQIIRFLNQLYLPFDPYNEEIYEQRDVTVVFEG